jgi:hypothetical protein
MRCVVCGKQISPGEIYELGWSGYIRCWLCATRKPGIVESRYDKRYLALIATLLLIALFAKDGCDALDAGPRHPARIDAAAGATMETK